MNTFRSIAKIRLRSGEYRYAGTVRDVYAGEIERCIHKHRTISEALHCTALTKCVDE